VSTEQNKEIASEYWLTFCNPNTQEASDLFVDDATCQVISIAGVAESGVVSKDLFVEMTLKSGGSKHPDRKESSAFPDGLELTPISIIAGGDHVVLEGESQSTVANANNYNHYSIHFELEDGKFDEVREYMGTKHQYDAASDSAHHAIRSTPSVSSLTFGVNPPSDSKAPLASCITTAYPALIRPIIAGIGVTGPPPTAILSLP